MQIRKKRADWALLLVNAVFVIIYMKYLRATYFWAVIFVFTSMHLLRQAAVHHTGEALKKPIKLAVHGIAAVLLVFFSLRAQYDEFCAPGMGFNLNYISPGPEAAFIRQNFPSLRLGNDYYCGSYLLWALWPENKVFIDARYFPYSEWYNEENELEWTDNPARREFLLEKYNCDLWCVSYGTPLLQYFISSPDWRLVFYGPAACVFVADRVASGQSTHTASDEIRRVHVNQAYAIARFASSINDLDVSRDIVLSMKPVPISRQQVHTAFNAGLNVGNCLMAHERFYDAIRVYSHALMLVRSSPLPEGLLMDGMDGYLAMVHDNLGYSFMQVNRLGEAADEFSRAMRINPGAEHAQKNLPVLTARIQELDESIASLESALGNSPDPQKILHLLAVYYSIRGLYDRALDRLMKESEMSPDNPRVYYDIACTYSKQGKLRESIRYLERALEKGFHDWDLMKKDHDLDNLKGSPHFHALMEGCVQK